LTSKSGFYRGELLKIIWPEKLQVIDRSLFRVGLCNLADVHLFNRLYKKESLKEGLMKFLLNKKEFIKKTV
jgi:hypothetical protein